MRKTNTGPFAAVLGLVAILILGGCSDDDKGTNGNGGGLSTQEQYALMARFLLDESGPVEGGIATLIVGHVEARYWGPIEEGGLAAKSDYPNMGTLAATDVDSFSATYNPITGWWQIYSEITEIRNGANVFIVRRDSVRFETAEGQPRAIPDETTSRFRSGGNVATTADKDSEEETYNLTLNNMGSIDIAGFNTAEWTISGTGTSSLGLDGAFSDTTVSIEVTTTTTIEDVVFPDEATCPTSGFVNSVMVLAIDVQIGEESAQGGGTWSVSLEFQPTGPAKVEYHSGTTHVSVDVSVCN